MYLTMRAKNRATSGQYLAGTTQIATNKITKNSVALIPNIPRLNHRNHHHR